MQVLLSEADLEESIVQLVKLATHVIGISGDAIAHESDRIASKMQMEGKRSSLERLFDGKQCARDERKYIKFTDAKPHPPS
jgi:hypothetical protein